MGPELELLSGGGSDVDFVLIIVLSLFQVHKMKSYVVM